MPEDMKTLTAKLVAAYLGSNTVAAGDVPALIQGTYAALIGTASAEPPPAEHQPPAVPVRKSVAADAIVCLECGKRQKMLKRHLATAHNLEVEEYRTKWSLPADYPMVAPDYAAKRSQLALKSGLGRKRSTAETVSTAEAAAPVEQKKGHRYPTSRWSKPSE